MTLTVTRTLTNLGNSCSSSAECSWLRNAKPTEHGAAVTTLFGAEEQDIAECLDIRELLNTTASKRADRIAQMLAKGAKSRREKAEAIARQTLGRLIDMDPANLPDDSRLLYPIAPKQVQAILKREAAMLEAKIGETGTRGATTWANEEKRKASSGLKQKDAARKELDARIALLPTAEATPERIAALDVERTLLAQRVGTSEERTRRRTELDRLTREIAAHVPPAPPDTASVVQVLAEADRLHNEAFGMTAQVLNDAEVEKFKRDLAITEDSIRDAENSPWATVLDHATSIMGLHNQAWGKVADEIQQHAEVIHREASDHLPNVASLHSMRRLGLEELESAIARKAKIDADNAQIIHKRDDLMKQASSLRADANDAEREQKAIFDNHRRNWQAHADFLRDQKAEAEKAIRRLERLHEDEHRAIGEAETALQRATDDVETCRQALEGIETPEDVAGLQAARSAVSEDIKRLTDARSTADELTKIVTEIDGLTAERDVFGALEWACQRVQEAEIQEQGAGLLGRIGGFLAAAGRTEKAYIRAGKGVVEIGWRRDKAEIPVQALSGGEWCLFCAALTSALLAIRPAELRFLLVEAGEADDATMRALCAGISAQEHITCAIVCTPHAPSWEQNGWNLIPLETPTPQEIRT